MEFVIFALSFSITFLICISVGHIITKIKDKNLDKNLEKIDLISWKCVDTNYDRAFCYNKYKQYYLTIKYKEKVTTFKSNGFGIVWKEYPSNTGIYDIYNNLCEVKEVEKKLESFLNQIKDMDFDNNNKEVIETTGVERVIPQTDRLLT